jgi:single-strand DNA-binding protein
MDQTATTRSTYTVTVPSVDVTVFGRLVADAEMRYAPSGVAVLSARFVVSRRYNQNNEWKEIAAFYRASIWREAAERLNERHLMKGDIVSVTFNPADLEAHVYESNGENKASLEIKSCQMKLIAQKAGNSEYAGAPETVDEIPF